MEIKISKRQWEQAGREAGWMKTAADENVGVSGAESYVSQNVGQMSGPNPQKAQEVGMAKAPAKTTGPMKVQTPAGQELSMARQIANKIPSLKGVLKDPIGRKWLVPVLTALGEDPAMLSALRPLLVRISKLSAAGNEEAIQAELADV